MTNKNWEERSEVLFGEDTQQLSDRSQGTRFLAQQLGWRGEYLEGLTSRNFERRVLMDSTFGNINFQRTQHPYLADLNLEFSGTGRVNWVENNNNFFVNERDQEFLFPGGTELRTQSGFSMKNNPQVVEGSHIYFPEPVFLNTGRAEYIESRAAWRVQVGKEPLTISSKVRPSEQITLNPIPWNPEEPFPFPERIEYFYGPWNSKNTELTSRWVLTMLGVPGFYEEDSLYIRPFSMTYPITDLSLRFDGLEVDGEEINVKRLKGVENQTNLGSRIVRFNVDTGLKKDLEFSSLRVKTLNPDTNEIGFVELIEEVQKRAEQNVHGMASVVNSQATPRLWGTEQGFKVSESTIGQVPLGSEDKNRFIRLPFHVTRGGEHWIKAEKVGSLFSYFGSLNRSIKKKEFEGETPEPIYERVYPDWRERRFYQEDYLVSRVSVSEEEEEGWSSAVFSEGDNENSWSIPRIEKYDPYSERQTLSSQFVGRSYTKVGDENLSGFLSKDLAEGKLVLNPLENSPFHSPYVENLVEEDPNATKACYCFFSVGYSAVGEPVF